MSNKSDGSENKSLPISSPSLNGMSDPTILRNGEEVDDYSETLYERMNLVVDKGQETVRLDKFLTARIENISRNKVQQAIEGGRVLVNNKTASANYKIRPGDNIICYSDRQVVGEESYQRKWT
jgi:23S rRNA pseudouridine1911/1915/1917 synthase